MDLFTDGLREASFEYGIKRLAGDLEISEGRLYKKLDVDQETHPLTLNDFIRIARITRDVRCVQPLLNAMGLKGVPVTEGGIDVEALLLELPGLLGDFINAVRKGGDVEKAHRLLDLKLVQVVDQQPNQRR